MEKAAIVFGGVTVLIGIIGVAVGFYPPNGDGAVLIAGAVILGSGIISRAIMGQRR